MKLRKRGKSISDAEVTNVDTHGLWVLVRGKEYFLPYGDFPWFQDARLSDIFDVKLQRKNHLHWRALDVDLSLESIADPNRFPLIYR